MYYVIKGASSRKGRYLTAEDFESCGVESREFCLDANGTTRKTAARFSGILEANDVCEDMCGKAYPHEFVVVRVKTKADKRTKIVLEFGEAGAGWSDFQIHAREKLQAFLDTTGNNPRGVRLTFEEV